MSGFDGAPGDLLADAASKARAEDNVVGQVAQILSANLDSVVEKGPGETGPVIFFQILVRLPVMRDKGSNDFLRAVHDALCTSVRPGARPRIAPSPVVDKQHEKTSCQDCVLAR